MGHKQSFMFSLNNTNLFEFAFENKYIREDKLVEMIVLLKNR